MKTGIITFHRAINYGAILQTYALQRYLNEHGYDAEVIDYRCEYMERFYKTMSIKNKSVKQVIRGLLNFGYAYNKKKAFYNFLYQNVKISSTVYNDRNIGDANKVYDKFITGSDQVFNYACSRFDKNYFLEFVQKPEKKLSYAASFGMKKIPDKYEEEYKRLLSSFYELSIRETDGQHIVKTLLGRETELTTDPVFLLEKKDWEKLARKPKIEHYILIYKLNTSNLIFDFARKLSKITGLKIVALNFDIVDQIKTPDIRGIASASVEEFLGYFKYADYIVTNSFHGTAFSIIFQRPFYVEALQKDFKPNDRVESLLNSTELNICKIKTLNDCEINIKRNFNLADSKMKEQRMKADKYIERILNESKRV